VKRMGMLIGIRPEKIDEYKRLHANSWPDILAMISGCNIKNYSIFLREPENLLFGCWEYHGDDFAADAAKMAADPTTQRWWELTNPCQERLPSAADGEWWSMMEEVFHHD